ncbi:hybrid sensor histidine kinase/response regulator [Methylobacterium radiodurans]|uniref:histidine kinase n=1 Tax=Methylobacterium radiodurans TaxID=2202828 RepID=A0A2U8W0W2_9HYPH|nr:hybrid sensor histidine kinase/response regulator [Methylobacterium radiodurans]AWN39130.1 hybrid sensor histidine kinase/response regulator [Methylobacterium radiodurans]
MADRIRGHDWAATPLGPVEAWPASLVTAVGIALGGVTPMAVFWGPDLVVLHNDAWAAVVGDKHPGALGRPAREVFPEAWDTLGPQFERALSGGGGVEVQDQRLVLDRRDGPEDAWFTYALSPVAGPDGTIAGVFNVAQETTRRVRAAAGLTASEERFRSFAENSADVLWIADPAGNRLEYLSPAYERVWGDRRELVMDDLGRWASLVHPEDRERAYVAMPRLLAGETLTVEYRIVRPDGCVRYIRDTGFPIRDAGGRLRRIGGIAQDVTAEHAREEALRASEEQFRVFAQAMPSHVWAARPDGQLYWFNEQVYAYSGAAAGTLDGTAWTGIVHPDEREEVERAWRRSHSTGGDYETEFRIRRADGAYRWFLVRGKPVRGGNGAVARWVGTCTDIDDRKRVMADLVRFNEALEVRIAERTAEHDRVWRNSRDLLVVVGVDGVFRAVNPAWRTILGYEPAEVVGRSYLEFIWPEDRVVTRTALAYAASNDDLTAFENRYRHRDGTPRWISWHTATEGDVVYAYGRDVTAEKERASALAQAEEALRQSQKLEAIGQLTGGVAHDFNNLLTIIRSSVDFLRRPDLAEARKARYLDAVSDTVDRAAKLTGQLLSFARRQALKPEAFDVAGCLRGVAEMLDTVTGARISVVPELSDAACFVRADRSQFETALVNMAVNARDAMDGEGTLTLRLACGVGKPAIRGHAPASGPFAAVSLTDTGSGIPPEVVGRIFEPFFTTKDVGKGTGLGLSQVFGFAKQSGGDVDVVSAPGRGSTFTLYLPETWPCASGEPRPTEPEAASGGTGQRVLVVEDNVEVGRFATQILEDLGYETTWAANADEALALLGQDGSGFDAVFSDVVMPGMNGVELAREIRRRFPGLPVVLASGYSHVLAQEGGHGFELLHKPYSAGQISRVLQRVTRRSPAP